MRPLAKNWQRRFLETLLLAEEIGDCPVLVRLVVETGEELAQRPDFSNQLDEYSAIKGRLEGYVAYEAANGKYSLLKRDHPSVKHLTSMGIYQTGLTA